MLKVSQSAKFGNSLALLTKLMIVLTMIIKELFRLLSYLLGVYIQCHCMLTSLCTRIVKQHHHLFKTLVLVTQQTLSDFFLF